MKTLINRTQRSLGALLLFFVLLSLSCGALAQVPVQQMDQSELQLIHAIKQIRAMKIDQAIDTLQSLIATKPRFKLAQLIYADLH